MPGDFVDMPLDLFGGLVTEIAPPDLPPGVSPDCQDCAFLPGAVTTRPGLLSKFNAIAGNPTINYLRTYVQPDLSQAMLALDSNGTLWMEDPPGTLSAIAGGLAPNAYGDSTTLFGREYLAISQTGFGVGSPLQFDGTYIDRVSQQGPGTPPSVEDVNEPLTAISRTSGVGSATTSLACGVTVGSLCTIAGVNGDATFNGQWPVVSVTGDSFTFWNVPQTFAVSTLSRSGGTVTATLSTTPTFASGDIVIAGASDSGFDGKFTTTSVSGNQVQWTQAGSDATAEGGTLYAPSFSAPVFGAVPAGAGSLSPLAYFTIQGNYVEDLASIQQVTISGGSNAAWRATWTVNSVFEYTYLGTQYTVVTITGTPSGASYGGTVTATLPDSSPSATGVAGPAGNITAGVHQISVAFITRQGYITKPAPPASWVAGGGFKAAVYGIPVGNSEIVGRLLIFTGAEGDTFFYIANGVPGIANSAMQINDDITTAITVDFSDTALLAASPAAALFSQVELGECAGVTGYASRLFWWGERNQIANLLNLDFSGGYISALTYPTGWTLDGTYGAGGTLDAASVPWGQYYAWKIQGTASGLVGMLTQPAYQDYLKVPILNVATAYSARVYAENINNPTGNVVVEIYSPSLGSLGKLTIAVTQFNSTAFSEVSGALLAAQSSIPSDALLRLYGDATLNGAVRVARIEIYPTAEPYNTSNVRASGVDDPESYDGVTGIVGVSVNDGQAVRSAFLLRNQIYFVKDHSIYSTQDDGVNEPSNWTLSEVSRRVGTLSVHGVDVGEDWAVIADLDGLYLYAGGEPVKISQEIQPLWDTINWDAAATLWVKVDKENKRILVGAPFGAATSPSQVLALDYRELVTASSIIETPPVHFSSYSGKMIALGLGRKWCAWSIVANSCDRIERSDGTMPIFLGNGAGTGKIYELADGQLTDDGAYIPAYYTTYYAPSHIEEQQYQLGSARKLFGWIRGYLEGSGTLTITARTDNAGVLSAVGTVPLVSPSAPVNVASAARLGNKVYVTLASAMSLAPGMVVVLAGIAGGQLSFNGQVTVAQVVSATEFIFWQAGPDENAMAATGTATAVARDFEIQTNVLGERVSYRMQTDQTAGSWFKLQRFIPSAKTDPWAPLRGSLA